MNTNQINRNNEKYKKININIYKTLPYLKSYKALIFYRKLLDKYYNIQEVKLYDKLSIEFDILTYNKCIDLNPKVYCDSIHKFK